MSSGKNRDSYLVGALYLQFPAQHSMPIFSFISVRQPLLNPRSCSTSRFSTWAPTSSPQSCLLLSPAFQPLVVGSNLLELKLTQARSAAARVLKSLPGFEARWGQTFIFWWQCGGLSEIVPACWRWDRIVTKFSHHLLHDHSSNAWPRFIPPLERSVATT